MASTYSTYLTFDGDCREALAFYRAAFGGDFNVFSTFADGPPLTACNNFSLSVATGSRDETA